ncbi:MAG: ABC transporter ATP-binding protein [Oligoflexales bacterium]
MALLEIKNLAKHYTVGGMFQKKAQVKALEDVSFSLEKGEILSVVGESGCGKTTLAKLLMQIEEPNQGSISFEGKALRSQPQAEVRKKMQMIFQDPYSSINARKKAWKIIAEPLFINTSHPLTKCREITLEVMAKVGLRPEYADRYPHMFSGGQRQRIGIARALVTHPEIIICDEPISALDVSIQAQILNLLMDLQRDMGLSYIFISHDLSVVRFISDKVLVIYLGKVVEVGHKKNIFENPVHPYTKVLLASTPRIRHGQRKLYSGKGEIPSRINPPKGCPFESRCPFAIEECRQASPPLQEVEGRMVACYRAGESLELPMSN